MKENRRKTAANKPIISFRDLMVLLSVFPSDKLSIKLLRSTLSEIIPNSVYFPEIAASDTLTDEMIINAYNYSADHECSYCRFSCRQTGSSFPCFLFEAGIKYSNLIYKNTPYKHSLLIGDCYRSGGTEDRTYYTTVYFYDYIYYLGTGEARNGRGHGRMSVHFLQRFFDHVIKDAIYGEDEKNAVDAGNSAPFLSPDFLRLMDAFIDRHMIQADSLLEDSLITAFPEACKTATVLFPKRNFTARDLLAALVALSLSDPDCVNEYLGNYADPELFETDPLETIADEKLTEIEDNTESSLCAPTETDEIIKRFHKRFSVYRAMYVFLALLISGADVFYISLHFVNPDSPLCGKLLPFILPLQPLLLVLCYFIKLRATTMKLVCDNASDHRFSAYLNACGYNYFHLPSATERFSSLTAPEEEVLYPIRICIGVFFVISSALMCLFTVLTDNRAGLPLGFSVLLMLLSALYAAIEHHSFFASYDRIRRHVSSVVGKASAHIGKFYFFKDRNDDFDPINTRFMIDTFYYPAGCSRLIYHKAYMNKRDKACSIVLLAILLDVFACICYLIDGETKYATEAAVITFVTVCFLCGPFSSHKGFIFSMLRAKYLSVFCPPQDYSATLRNDILLHALSPYDIISGKKAFVRASVLYDTDSDDSFQPDFHSEIRISYDSFYRFSAIRILTVSILLLTVGFYSIFTSWGMETERIICLSAGIVFYCAFSGGLFDNVFPVYSSSRFRKRRAAFFRKNSTR